jgi:hypothetical protein
MRSLKETLNLRRRAGSHDRAGLRRFSASGGSAAEVASEGQYCKNEPAVRAESGG